MLSVLRTKDKRTPTPNGIGLYKLKKKTPNESLVGLSMFRDFLGFLFSKKMLSGCGELYQKTNKYASGQ